MSGEPNYNGACTNWYGVDIDRIYQMLEHEGSNESWSQVTAYGQTYELLAYHAGELKSMRDKLVVEWQSPAAKVFSGYIDRMLKSMSEVGDAAVDNMTGLTNINAALMKARTEVGKLREQWHANKGKEEDSKIFGMKVPGVSNAIDGLPDGWEENIKMEVARQMSLADRDVAEGTNKMTVPPIFVPPDQSGDTTVDNSGGNGTRSGSGSGSSGAAGTGPTRYPGSVSPPYVPPPSSPPSESLVYDDGSWLAGNPTVTPANTGGVGGGGVGAGGVIGAIPGNGANVGPGNGLGPAAGIGAGFVAGAFTSGLIGGNTGSGTGSGIVGAKGVGNLKAGATPAKVAGGLGSSPMAPGGVIGGARGGGPLPGGQFATGGSAARTGRTASTGGVIDGARGGARSGPAVAGTGAGGGTAATRATGPAMATSAGARRGDDEHDEDRPGFDPDNPWAVEEGGPEIITPPVAPSSHDAGPGVIGIDR